MPDIYRARMYWKYRQSITSGAVFAPIVLRGNSVFDPIYALGGTAPYGYNQLSLYYQQYRVWGCKIIVNFFNVGAILPSECAVNCNTLVVPFTTMATMAECEYTKVKQCGGSNSNQRCQIKMWMSTDKVYGNKKGTWAIDDTYKAQIGNNPSNQWFWSIATQCIDSATAATVWMDITVIYYTEFFDKYVFPPS